MSAVPLPPGGPPVDAPPVCPRHPDRICYVRCQRCERPVCPQCQRPAPVGVQCVDCVAAGARATAPRATFGAARVGGRPVVTMTIIAVCVVVYVLQLTVSGLTNALAFAPLIGETQPWRFLTSAFLHSPSTVLHIAMNMLALWTVGPMLERALGRARFATLYLLSALGGSVGMVVWAALVGGSAWWTAAVGASGAVFGLFGAVLLVLRRVGASAGGIIGVIVLNVVIGFVVPGIAWQAHIGGLITGGLLGAAYVWAPAGRRRELSIVASVAMAVLLVVVTLLAYTRS